MDRTIDRVHALLVTGSKVSPELKDFARDAGVHLVNESRIGYNVHDAARFWLRLAEREAT
jgi:hypothetical protein